MSEAITAKVSADGEWTFHDEQGAALPAEMIMGVDFGLDQSCSAAAVFKISHEDGSVTFASPPPTPMEFDPGTEDITQLRDEMKRLARLVIDEAQNMPSWPCPGSRLPTYHTGSVDYATGRGILECIECGKLWTFDQLVGGRVPFHKASRRSARRILRQRRAARKNRRGW